jgi:AbrB family looped-hinge helix DNA binding protein
MNMITRISAKGQVVLPKAARDLKGWQTGDRLEVVDTPAGLLLRPDAAPSVKRSADDVFATLREIAGRTARSRMTDEEALQLSIKVAVRRDKATKSK